MKNMFYFLTLLFLMGSCSPEADLESFKQKENQKQAMKDLKACLLNIDCSYAFQVTEEGCLFDLWDVLEQIKQKNCPGATMSWENGTQPWVNLGKGEEYQATLNVENCEGFSCLQYTVEFSCGETCTPDDCNYNIDIIEGDNVCEYAITFDCDTQLEVDGSSQQSIPLGNGVCAVILTLDKGETSDLTFTTEDGQECSETIRCGKTLCDCDGLDLQILMEKNLDGCCVFTLNVVTPPGFNCPYDDAKFDLTYVDGSPIAMKVFTSGPGWIKYVACGIISNAQILKGTLELFQNGQPACSKITQIIIYNGCQ